LSVAVTHQRSVGSLSRVTFEFLNEKKTADLPFTFVLGAGVSILVDAAEPTRWRTIFVASWDDAARPVLLALVGAEIVAELDDQLKAKTADWYEELIEIQWGGQFEVPAIQRSAEPLLHAAAVEALNQWLQLPLRQVLVDAERAVTRWEAAAGLQAGRTRDQMLADALVLARAASWDLATYFKQLWNRQRPMPQALRLALARLIKGYESLLAEVRTRAGDDEDLRSVVSATRGLLDRLALKAGPGKSKNGRATGSSSPAGHESIEKLADFVSFIDPSHVPARTLGLCDDLQRPEIGLRQVRIDGIDAVEILVPAYHAFSSHSTGTGPAERLLVRLLDLRTGEQHQVGLLTYEPPRSAGRPSGAESIGGLFRGILPAPGLDLSTVRADVFHVDSDDEPAPKNQPADLLRVRAAIQRLARLRQRAAVIVMGHGTDGGHSSAVPENFSVADLGQLMTAELDAVDDPLGDEVGSDDQD
jgi:hypothetical protein